MKSKVLNRTVAAAFAAAVLLLSASQASALPLAMAKDVLRGDARAVLMMTASPTRAPQDMVRRWIVDAGDYMRTLLSVAP